MWCIPWEGVMNNRSYRGRSHGGNVPLGPEYRQYFNAMRKAMLLRVLAFEFTADLLLAWSLLLENTWRYLPVVFIDHAMQKRHLQVVRTEPGAVYYGVTLPSLESLPAALQAFCLDYGKIETICGALHDEKQPGRDYTQPEVVAAIATAAEVDPSLLTPEVVELIIGELVAFELLTCVEGAEKMYRITSRGYKLNRIFVEAGMAPAPSVTVSAPPAAQPEPAAAPPAPRRLPFNRPPGLSEFHWERANDLYGKKGEEFDVRELCARDLGYENAPKTVMHRVLTTLRVAKVLHYPDPVDRNKLKFGPVKDG